MAKHKTGNSVWPAHEPEDDGSDISTKVRVAFEGTLLSTIDLSIYHVQMHNTEMTKWTAYVSTTGPDGHKLYYQIYHDGTGTCFVMMPEQPTRNADLVRGIEF